MKNSDVVLREKWLDQLSIKKLKKKESNEWIQGLKDHPEWANAADAYSEHALLLACRRGDVERVQALIDAGAHLESRSRMKGQKGWTPLMVAAKRGKAEIIKALIDKGACVNARATMATSALILGASEQHEDVVRCLLEAGADVNVLDYKGRTALMHAARLGWLKGVILLVKEGPSGYSMNPKGEPSLYIAGVNGHAEVVQWLIQEGAILAKDAARQSDMFNRLAGLGQVEVMRILVEAGVPVNVKKNEVSSALMSAIECCQLDAVKWLLKNGAETRSTSGTGSPILSAINASYPELVKELIQAGVDCRVKNHKGETPLIIAARKGWPHIVQALLSQGVDVNEQDNQKNNALRYACQSRSVKTVEVLLNAGALFSKDYLTEKQIAQEAGAEEIVLLLEARAAQQEGEVLRAVSENNANLYGSSTGAQKKARL